MFFYFIDFSLNPEQQQTQIFLSIIKTLNAITARVLTKMAIVHPKGPTTAVLPTHCPSSQALAIENK